MNAPWPIWPNVGRIKGVVLLKQLLLLGSKSRDSYWHQLLLVKEREGLTMQSCQKWNIITSPKENKKKIKELARKGRRRNGFGYDNTWTCANFTWINLANLCTSCRTMGPVQTWQLKLKRTCKIERANGSVGRDSTTTTTTEHYQIDVVHQSFFLSNDMLHAQP